MKNLSDIPFPPILDTSSGDIIADFFNPALAVSTRYDRGVGLRPHKVPYLGFMFEMLIVVAGGEVTGS